MAQMAHIEKMNSTQQRFESLDFIDQAKVVRISLNQNRQKRFMNIFDQNKTSMHTKIKNMGTNAISKSVLKHNKTPGSSAAKETTQDKLKLEGFSAAVSSINVHNVDSEKSSKQMKIVE